MIPNEIYWDRMENVGNKFMGCIVDNSKKTVSFFCDGKIIEVNTFTISNGEITFYNSKEDFSFSAVLTLFTSQIKSNSGFDMGGMKYWYFCPLPK